VYPHPTKYLMPSGSGSIPPQPDKRLRRAFLERRHKDSHMTIARSLDFFEHLEKKADGFDVVSGEMYSGRYSRVFPRLRFQPHMAEAKAKALRAPASHL
jgi:hypothetical protein